MYFESSEAIEFQKAGPRSNNLGDDMSVVIQEVLDVKAKAPEYERIRTVIQYFFKVAGPKLIEVIYRHTGLSMSIVVPQRLICNFAVLMEFDPAWRDANIIIAQYSGLFDKPINSSVTTRTYRTLKELQDLSESLDTKTGHLDPKKIAAHGFKCKLYFDIFSAFLIQETGAKACEPMAPRELTAIILHEIGHVVTMIEHAAQTVYTRTVMETALKNFMKNGNKIDVLQYLSRCFTKKKDEVGVKAIDKLIQYAQRKNSVEGSVTLGFDILFSSLTALATVLMVGLGYLVMSPLAMLYRLTIGDTAKHFTELNKGKSSDFAQMPQNQQTCEILADQYVARWGYSDGLAGGLKKIISWCRISGLGVMSYQQSNSASWYGRMLPWLIITMAFGDECANYPTETDRYSYMMEETLKAFKEEGMDKEVLDAYMESYKQIKAILSKPTAEMKYTNLWNTLHKVFHYIVNIPESVLVTGRFDEEYSRLYKQIQHLSNNELYAQARQLQAMQEAFGIRLPEKKDNDKK